MALLIACDLDGTLADMESALQRETERVFGPGVELRDGPGLETVEPGEDPTPDEVVVKRGRGLTDRRLRRLW